MSLKMLKNDGSPDQLVLPDLDSPKLYNQDEANRRQDWILSHFDKSHRTESAFYLTFCRLDRNDISFLKALFKLEDDWAVFRKLCTIYQIKVS